MTDCIFCKIIKNEIPSTIILDSEDYLAFEPLHKAAPVHVLCIPKKHIEKVDSISGKEPVWQGLFEFANQVIKMYELDKTGYRIANNGAGYHGVNHEHIHILGGKGWRPTDNL